MLYIDWQKVRIDMEFPTMDKFAKDIAEKALDEIVYEGKTIREWVEILVRQQPCEDCISREQAVYVASGYCAPQNIADELRKLPSVTPKQPFINKPCISEGVCREDKINVLKKIRVEIIELRTRQNVGVLECLDIIDEYIAENEDKE